MRCNGLDLHYHLQFWATFWHAVRGSPLKQGLTPTPHGYKIAGRWPHLQGYSEQLSLAFEKGPYSGNYCCLLSTMRKRMKTVKVTIYKNEKSRAITGKYTLDPSYWEIIQFNAHTHSWVSLVDSKMPVMCLFFAHQGWDSKSCLCHAVLTFPYSSSSSLMYWVPWYLLAWCCSRFTLYKVRKPQWLNFSSFISSCCLSNGSLNE